MTEAIDDSGLAQDDDALFDAWEALHPADGGAGEASPDSDTGQKTMSATEAVGKMPYDWSPARVRCMELSVELFANDPPAS